MQIKTIVTSILYPKEVTYTSESTWYVLSTTCGKVVGSTRLRIVPGRLYIFDGNPSVYQGQQNFKFTSIREDIPEDALGLLKYACNITNGIGEAFASSIWEKYGEGWKKQILTSAHGKKEELLRATVATLSTDADKTAAIAYMLSIGATQHLAESAFLRFGSATIGLVRENPYVLAELPQQSFLTIDGKFRVQFGIGLNDHIRIKSLLHYYITNEAETLGNTIFDIDVVITEASGKYSVDPTIVREIIERDYERFENCITTKALYKHEELIHSYVLQSEPCEPIEVYESEISLDDSQREACRFVLSRTGLSCINGGAGCGKTTIIRTIAVALAQADERFRICAFAGKAAARVREATGFDASTIHSMLEYRPDIGFGLNPKEVENDTIIIDEASMVPASLLAEVCKRNPKRIILVGDEGQLPPVGAGAPFHDLVRLGDKYTRTVTTCYRNSEAIFQAAYAVRNGQAPVSNKSENESFKVVNVKNAKAAQEYIESIVKYLDFEQDIIIAPRNGENESDASVKAFNIKAIQSLGYANVDSILIGQRVICLKNDPFHDVWNGTIAKVDAINTDGGMFVTTDMGNHPLLPKKYVKDSLAHAYALTIHKSQGSQYRRVVICALFRDTIQLLNREMLYTAITRAKGGCVVVTDTNLMNIINQQAHRNTVLGLLLGC